MKNSITAIILTYNEEIHIERCINSIKDCVERIIVIDSFSDDETETIVKKYNIDFYQNKFINHSQQFNWAIDNIKINSTWILRLDSDEYLSSGLILKFNNELPFVDSSVNGIAISRNIIFQDKLIKYGGISNMKVIRLFRNGHGRCESRWMDEHIKISGKVDFFEDCIFDHNLNSLDWWVCKHNNYASKEALEMLNLKFSFFSSSSFYNPSYQFKFSFKRFLKNIVYCNFPLYLRAFLYFFYRYVFLLGFMDGKVGFSFHFFQGFWYRYLVDEKISEVNRYMLKNNVEVRVAIQKVLGLKI